MDRHQRTPGEVLPSNAPEHPQTGPVAKRFGRRSAIKALGVALTGLAARPAAAGEARSGGGVAAAAPAWRPLATGSVPRAFAGDEFRALEELVELILPATDTPGARAAGVHWYLDDVALAEPRTCEQIKDGLRELEERSRAAFGRGFELASEAERSRVLGELMEAGDPFFAFIKARVVDAYYKSEAGQLGELGWVGHEFWDTFPGACRHPDPLRHPRPAAATRAARGEGEPR